ncbi:MAG: hypothetical protein CR997_03375 [Acidobacteria bacterium]|nr:MAG: hypothetical protein CR997_03375 [Acidobacteriota bacterium]
MVSNRHARIVVSQNGYTLEDLSSTNGTFLNGLPIDRCDIQHGDRISLGLTGIHLLFITEQELNPEQTIHLDRESLEKTIEEKSSTPEKDKHQLLSEAVEKARLARKNPNEQSGQTLHIMREALEKSIDQTLKKKTKKHFHIISILVLAVVLLMLGFTIQSRRLASEKSDIDKRILEIEEQIQTLNDPEAVNRHLKTLISLQEKAEKIEKNLLYEIGARSKEDDFIEREVHRLLKELGAETYSVPPEFLAEIKNQITYFHQQERQSLQKMLKKQAQLKEMKSIFKSFNLPPDLIYMAYVESRFKKQVKSRKQAVGLWQMRRSTAKAYGLTITTSKDERLDISKSTQAAAQYIKYLILDFGSGSSVMLAVAAYNCGPTKLRHIIRQIPNPIEQRNFWYLYRTRSLPRETQEYVPKVLAVMIIARNYDYFFKPSAS